MKTIQHGRAISFKGGIEVLAQRPMSVSELSEYHPAMEIAGNGGGVVTPFRGKRVIVNFDPTEPGFIELKIGNESAIVHKDELIHIVRFAKGSMGV